MKKIALALVAGMVLLSGCQPSDYQKNSGATENNGNNNTVTAEAAQPEPTNPKKPTAADTVTTAVASAMHEKPTAHPTDPNVREMEGYALVDEFGYPIYPEPEEGSPLKQVDIDMYNFEYDWDKPVDEDEDYSSYGETGSFIDDPVTIDTGFSDDASGDSTISDFSTDTVIDDASILTDDSSVVNVESEDNVVVTDENVVVDDSSDAGVTDIGDDSVIVVTDDVVVQ